jgi:hypothetical protein
MVSADRFILSAAGLLLSGLANAAGLVVVLLGTV